MNRLVFAIAFGALSATSSFAAYPDCPAPGDPAAITEWRDAASAELLRSSSSTNASAIAGHLVRCFADKPPGCMKRLADRTEGFLTESASRDTHARTDERKRPPQELLASVDANWNFELRGDAEEIARQLGWPTVRYKSRHAGGFDRDTPSLLMIRVPGDKVVPPVDYDRYLNIPLPADTGVDEMNPVPQAPLFSPETLRQEALGGPSMPRTMTIVTIKRRTATNPAPSEVYFEKFKRNGFGGTKFASNFSEGLRNCFACHPNGLRAISPMGFHVRAGEAQLPVESWLAVKEMNDSMEQAELNLPSNWSGHTRADGTYRKFLVSGSFGPEVGPTTPLTTETKTLADGRTQTLLPTRTRQFIMGDAGKPGCYNARPVVNVTDIFGRAPGLNNIYRLTPTPNIRWSRVKDAMNCASCHNNVGRGTLNAGTNWPQIDFKILVDQSMPKGAHLNPMDAGGPNKAVIDSLNPDERIALANCLLKEFELEKDKYSEWLRQPKCDAIAAEAARPESMLDQPKPDKPKPEMPKPEMPMPDPS